MKVALLTTDAREFFKDYSAPQPYFGTAPQALLQGFAKIPTVEVHVIACTKSPVAHTPKLGENVFFHSLLVPGGWARTLYHRCVQAQRQKIWELRPDIVHGQGTERDCGLAAVRSGFPNIITIHGNQRAIAKVLNVPFFSFLTVQSMLESWTIRRTIGVLCLTRYMQEQVRGRTGRTWILPNAVDEKFFEMQWTGQTSPYLLCVANIDPRKNQNFLIRALDPIAEKHGMQVRFLGAAAEGHPYYEEFKALVAERSWCRYEGFKRGAELHSAMTNARMIVLPSLEENCPMAVLEGMAIGVPVVAARSGGTPDLIEDGHTALMFDPTDAEGVQRAVSRIWNDQSFASAVAASGKKRGLEKHYPVRIAEKHIDIYRDALKSIS
jgi:glycosyltransferase involved in cell wall biosynthesis